MVKATKLVVASVVAMFFGQDVQAKPTFIQCQSVGGREPVTIILNEEKAFGHVLSCISGRFVEEMTPCAPDGGFGLSAPTGTAGLTGVVDRWQDYGNHDGGVVGHWINSAQIYFNGGFNSEENGYREQWSFMVDRLSGKATLTIEKDNGPSVESGKFEYLCNRGKQKF